MGDFIFGTLATDAQRTQHVKKQRLGIWHEPVPTPPDPIPGQPVKLSVSVGPSVPANRVTIYWTTDDVTPKGQLGRAHVGNALTLQHVDTEWDTLLWGYRSLWEGRVPGQTEGVVVRYTIEAWHNVTGYSAFLQEGGKIKVFGYAVDREITSRWLQKAIIYQIFVDRFAPDPGERFDKHVDLQKDILGGTLRGITVHLDHIAGLGATAIWLTPIFPSPSYHRYDATDYSTVDPRLGTLDDFEELVQAAHRRGIRIILDFVANHCSHLHPAFVGAQKDRNAPTMSWFTFDVWPRVYDTFFGVKSMPRFNVDYPAVRDYLIEQARLWLQRGVDGFRLDHAHGPSHLFWSFFRLATRAVAPESALFGEVVETASLMRSFVGRMDGVLDFLLLEKLRQFFAYQTLSVQEFDAFLHRHFTYFPRDFVLPSFLDNHDMNRFLWVVNNDKRRLRLAALFLFTMPGPPVVYYGTEVGLSQPADVVQKNGHHYHGYARMPMVWGEGQDRRLYAYFQALHRLRRQGGDIWWSAPVTPVIMDDAQGIYAYRRGDYVVLLNNSAERVSVPLNTHRDLMLTTAEDVEPVKAGVRLPPFTGAVVV